MYFPNGSVFYRQILDRQLGLRKEHTDCGIDVYENQFFLPRFYGAKYGALIVGPRDTLETLAYEVNFSDWAVFFADQMKTDVLKLLDDLDAVVFFPGRDLDDLTLATVNESYRIDLWNYARPLGGNSEGAWIRDMWWIYDYPTEIPESGSGWLVSAGRPIFETNTATMKIHFKTENTGLHDLWLRVGFGQDRGLLSLSLDHSLIFEERLSSSSHEGLKWIKLGSVWMSEGDHVITVSSRDGMNSLDELVVMPHDKITSLRNTLENRLSTKKVITFNNTRNKPTPSSLVQRHYISNLDATGKEGSRTQIEMQRIDPTKYVLRINLTIDRTFIIFSEAYNPSWQMSTRDYRLRPIIAYGGINCFILKSEGEVTAELEFLPQTYLNAGTYITVFGSVVIVSYIVAELLFSRITRILKMRKTTVQS
jgi:hypothetical protein